MKTLLVTGGAGFIGSMFVRIALEAGYRVVVLDALTYAGRLENLTEVEGHSRFAFIRGNITDFDIVTGLLSKEQPIGLLNFAAESHVDNSITGPDTFVETNIIGTFRLLEAVRMHITSYNAPFRFLQVSTDEVFGSLGPNGFFTESTAYDPRSPYSASKAAADHLVRAWAHTYNLDAVVTNCSNNYGPRQYPEKLIPRMINSALSGKPMPVYGEGLNVRDWIHVKDHSRGVLLAFEKGTSGDSYCFGGKSERRNIELVHSLCEILDELSPRPDGKPHAIAISFVKDRPGHDYRYAIDDSKAERELGFTRAFHTFDEGLRDTVEWYLKHPEWIASIG